MVYISLQEAKHCYCSGHSPSPTKKASHSQGSEELLSSPQAPLSSWDHPCPLGQALTLASALGSLESD